MASAELIVAKASLSGALFRHDPQPCSRDEIEAMLTLLNSATTECSPANVQKCKQWALVNLVPSSARVAPFTKYLLALANSFGNDAKKAKQSAPAGGGTGTTTSGQRPEAAKASPPREPSAKRRRLYVLYIVNDLLYHVKFRTADDSFAAKLEPSLPLLVRSAASFANSPKLVAKIRDLVKLWAEKAYFSPGFVDKLNGEIDQAKAAAASAAQAKADSDPAGGKKVRGHASVADLAKTAAKTAPYVMPASHGDAATPWYDLPAGNWLPVLEPDSTRPINPAMIKPLQLNAGPADKTLADAVKKLLVDVDRIYADDTGAFAGSTEGNELQQVAQISRMGERIELDEITSDVMGGDTYYGWSRDFCQKMKARRQKKSGTAPDTRDGEGPGRGRPRSRSPSLSRSRSRSRSYSRSPRSPQRRDRRSRDGSLSSRSPSRPAFKRQRTSRSPSDYAHTRTRKSRSRGRDWSRSRSRSRSKSRSRSRSRSPRGDRRRSASDSRRRRGEGQDESRVPAKRSRSSTPASSPGGNYEYRSPTYHRSSSSPHLSRSRPPLSSSYSPPSSLPPPNHMQSQDTRQGGLPPRPPPYQHGGGGGGGNSFNFPQPHQPAQPAPFGASPPAFLPGSQSYPPTMAGPGFSYCPNTGGPPPPPLPPPPPNYRGPWPPPPPPPPPAQAYLPGAPQPPMMMGLPPPAAFAGGWPAPGPMPGPHQGMMAPPHQGTGGQNDFQRGGMHGGDGRGGNRGGFGAGGGAGGASGWGGGW